MCPEIKMTLLAQADYGEGYVVWLYRTGEDNYFATERTTWGKTERILSLSRDRAIKSYNEFPVHLVDYQAAFP